MKPNEEHNSDEQNIIVQLGMLILKSRSMENTQISGIDTTSGLVKNEDVSFHYEKEAFFPLWKCCEIVFIEVWLHRDKQFNKEEAVQGHSGYLVMEQWQIEMTKSSSSETGFHCTGKMLMQAIKSKLYFSQLSAWLSLSKGEFPRYIHFRSCRKDNRVPLQRFCKPPEFHQFPRVPIDSAKELQVTLNSLPRFDISKEHPVFSWVLADSQSENLTRTGEGNVGLCDCESACPMRNKNRFGTSGNDCRTSNAVRKLEFPEPNGKNQTEVKCHEVSKETCLGNRSWYECQGTSSMAGSEHLTSTEMTPCWSLDVGGVSKTVRETPFCQRGGNPSGKCDPEISDKCSALERRHLFSSHATAVDNVDDFGKEDLESSTSNEKTTNLDSSNLYPMFNSDSMCVSVESFEKTKGLDSSSFSNANPGSNSDTVGNYVTPFKASDRTNCRNCSRNKLNDFNDLKCGLEERFTQELCSSKKTGVAESDTQGSSKFEAVRTRDMEKKLRKTWTFMKEAHVLPKTKKDFDDVPASMRKLIEEDVKRKLNEKLWKCLSPEKRYHHGDHLTSDRHKDSKEGGESSKDIVFPGQRSTVTCHAQLASRHHFRHASTGTLPVFHPSTGLPVSSSPAPFRKPRELSTVDDIHSSPYSSFNLQNVSGVLSRSAPTLATQSLLGNFEESVLNDRLLPDGVVEGFSAELSASSSRKCLAHVTLPVEAYFFKLSDDDAPSPYMGYISLDVPELPRKGYHVPKKGTIQLTLFNPNQTVVKVFVVLYDFSDMQPNFRTFLRQRTTSLVESDTLVDRNHDNLHYLVHLRFASSKSGRVYLHTDIRVIFARHPPDQVYLRTSTSGPTNPKYVPRQET